MVRPFRFPDIALRIGIALCLLLVFAVDCLTRRGLAVGVAYVGAVWLAHLDHYRRQLPVWVAAISSLLLLTGAFFSPGAAQASEVFLNRGLVLTVVWLAAYISLRINGIERLLWLNQWRTRTVLESALDAVIALDEDGQVTIWNERATRLFGWSREDAVGRPIQQLILPEELGNEQGGALKQMLSGQIPIAGQRLELLAKRRDGSVVPVEFTITTARTEDAITVSAFVRDITPWRIEEQKQQRAIAEARVLEETTRAMATAQNFDQSLQRCLEALCREVQWPVGHVWLPDPTRRWLVSTDIWYLDRATCWSQLVAASRQLKVRPGQGLPGEAWDQQAPVWYADLRSDSKILRGEAASLGLVSGFAFPITSDGQVVALLEFFSDGARARDEDLLQLLQRVAERIADVIKHQTWEEQRARLAAIVDTSYDAIIGRSLNGTIISWNRGAERMYGYTEEEAIGQTMAFVQGPRAGEAAEALTNVGQRVEQREILRRRKDGKLIPVSLTVSPIVDSTGRTIGTATIERDITERKRAEAELRKAKETAESASHARSEFLANVSHELRTPINAVLGMTQLALTETLSDVVRDYISTARNSAESLLVLLNDILDFSRLESGRFRIDLESFPIRELIEETVRTLSDSAAEKGLELNCEVQPDVPIEVVGDAVRLRQVLTNLITNAIKFTERGEVLLSVQLVRRWPQEVRLRFVVRDTGIGISQADQQRIFEPFTQADSSSTRRFGGTGLGLTICAELLRLMGGRLLLQSEIGTGSEFSFMLSFAVSSTDAADYAADAAQDGANAAQGLDGEDHQHPSRAQPLAIPQDAKPPGKLTVLLAEDTPANQKVVTSILRKRGHEVRVAPDGREALRLFQDQSFDVILMDVQMPQWDGYRATEEIRRLERRHQRSPTPIIALTAHAMRGDREKCLEAGMDAYLAKPIDVEELLSLVESLADFHHGEILPAMSSEQPSTASSASKPIINLQRALQRLGGDMDLFREFAGFFDEDAPVLLKQIESAVEQRSAERLAHSAHSLKGLAANLGAEAVQSVAAEMEHLGRCAELEEAPQHLEQLREELRRADQVLQQYRGQAQQ